MTFSLWPTSPVDVTCGIEHSVVQFDDGTCDCKDDGTLLDIASSMMTRVEGDHLMLDGLGDLFELMP
jgi:hypothetical protein